MACDHYQRAKHIFYQACEMEPQERSAFVESECNGDSALRDEIDRLLRVEDDSGFLQRPALDEGHLLHRAVAGMSNDRGPALLPVSIGRYRIIRLIGEGGMGSVYEAEQDSPRRTVALKVIRAALPSKRMVQRFEREIEILGRLHHPNIAQIHEAGLAETPAMGDRVIRLPYYAMEFIDGLPLTEHAARHELSDRDRLVILATVCEAVHFGHVNGVVHRDLKPGNILVDAMGQPKIIDFGVARATNMDHSIATLNTHSGMLIGTLAYMSPEQVGGADRESADGSDNATIDGRCDVYALGVIGFELLGGRLPYELAGRSVPEAARIIRDEDPSSLSSVSRTHRGDVETIIRRAMAKEPSRRYSTAAEMAADIRRFLNDEPILARPPTLRYQLSKFATRHKEFAVGLALVFVVLIAGLVATTILLIRATAAEQFANAQKELAFANLQHAEAAGAFMQRVLASATPWSEGGGRERRVADMLDAAAAEIDTAIKDQPVLKLQAHRVLGEAYLNLGLFAEADVHLHTALDLARIQQGERSLEWLQITERVVWSDLAFARDTALPRAVAALDQATDLLGADHDTTLNLLFAAAHASDSNSDYDQAHRLALDLLKRLEARSESARPIAVNDVLCMIGNIECRKQEWDQGIPRLQRAFAMAESSGPSSRLGRPSGGSLGFFLDHAGLVVEAEQQFRLMLARQERALGEVNPETVGTIHNFVNLLTRCGKLEEAATLRTRELAAVSQLEKYSQPSIHQAQLNGLLGQLLARLGQDDQAAASFTQAIEFCRNSREPSTMLAQAWWREGVIRLGMGLHRPWRSEALRMHCCRLVDDQLKANPTNLFDLDEVDWDSFRYELSQWQDAEDNTTPAAMSVVSSGSLNDAYRLSEPPPGVYRLDLHADRREGAALKASEWMLVSNWDLSLYRAWNYTTQVPERLRTLFACEPKEHKTLPALALANWWETGFGPGNWETYFAIAATTQVDVPPGKYRVVATADDGIRVWIDGQLLIDQWVDRAWQWALTHDVEVSLAAGPHEVRIEYNQIVGDARLWVRLVPIEEVSAALDHDFRVAED